MKGCGRTVSVLFADIIKKFTVRTSTISSFLKNILAGNTVFKAFCLIQTDLTTTTIYRIFRRFIQNQPYIRTAIFTSTQPFHEPKIKDPFVQTIKNLFAVFPDSVDPVSAFQCKLSSKIDPSMA